MSKPCSSCRGRGQIPLTWDGPEVLSPCPRCAGTGRVGPVEEILVTVAEVNGIDPGELWGLTVRDFVARVAARSAERQPASDRPTLFLRGGAGRP